MACIDPAIGKHQMRIGRAFLRTLLPAAAVAAHIPDRDDWRFRRDRDDWRFRSSYVYRSEPTYTYSTYYVGEQRYYNGYNWTWDGNRWCRRDRGVSFYLRF